MKKTCLILFLIVFSALSFAKKAAEFPELKRPQGLIIDENRIFIPDYPEVYIYSLKDFRLIKKFGKEGEGPGEFKARPDRFNISVQPDYLFVNCDMKIFYFTWKGKLINEINTRGVGYYFFAAKDRLLGRKIIQEEKIRYTPLYLFDSNLNPVKELARIKPAGSAKAFRAFHRSFNVEFGKDKIFVNLGTKFVVKIFDYNGKLLHVIDKENPENRVKVTEADKKEYYENLKLTPGYQTIINRIVFPEYFPAIRSDIGLQYDHHGGIEKLYVITEKKKDDRAVCFLFDVKGTFLKKVNLPFQSPLDIKNGRLYQLIENEEAEVYELHVTGIPLR